MDEVCHRAVVLADDRVDGSLIVAGQELSGSHLPAPAKAG
jgi:hypothetical protein